MRDEVLAAETSMNKDLPEARKRYRKRNYRNQQNRGRNLESIQQNRTHSGTRPRPLRKRTN
jgi:hypothetical protein